MNVQITFRVPDGYERGFIENMRARPSLTAPPIKWKIVDCRDCEDYGFDLCKLHGLPGFIAGRPD